MTLESNEQMDVSGSCAFLNRIRHVEGARA